MHEQGTPKIETQEDAVQVLLAWQVESGGIETIPASGLTEETEAGWAFFNANGYLGTVTPKSEVIEEAQFTEAEDEVDDDDD